MWCCFANIIRSFPVPYAPRRREVCFSKNAPGWSNNRTRQAVCDVLFHLLGWQIRGWCADPIFWNPPHVVVLLNVVSRNAIVLAGRQCNSFAASIFTCQRRCRSFSIKRGHLFRSFHEWKCFLNWFIWYIIKQRDHQNLALISGYIWSLFALSIRWPLDGLLHRKNSLLAWFWLLRSSLQM